MALQENQSQDTAFDEVATPTLNEGRYLARVSREPDDPEWDAFLGRTPGGEIKQSAIWGRLKGLVGWDAIRIVVSEGSVVVAGLQMLIRRVPFLGALGYVTKGPVLATTDAALFDTLIDELHRVARAHRVRYLVLQPPSNGEPLLQPLLAHGFRPCSMDIGPTATLRIDLTQDDDEILAAMNSSTRRNIRYGLKKGLTAREGGDEDVPIFHRMLEETGRRQGFSPDSLEYYQELWQLCRPGNHVRSFIVEYEGEPVSAMLALAYGDTLYVQRAGWNGMHPKRRPNELMQWFSIQWAKKNGYRYYDFEGIDPTIAKILSDGNPLPSKMPPSVTTFKLGFGGAPLLMPGSYDYAYLPLVRWCAASLPKIESWSITQMLLSRTR